MHIPHPYLERPHHSTEPILCDFPSPRSHLRKQADGFTYERSAIELWFENHNTSPATGLELESKQLKPNHSLRSLIRDLS